MKGPLIHNGDEDYTLKPDETTVWITAGQFSIYILKGYGKVSVSIFPIGEEDETPLSTFTEYEDGH